MPISPAGELVGVGLHAFFDAGDTWYESLKAGKSWQSFGAGVHLNLDKQQFRFEAASASPLFVSDDMTHGYAAMAKKTPPDFEGK